MASRETNILGASRNSLLSSSQYLAIILGGVCFMVVVMVLAIVVPIQTNTPHYQYTAPPPPTSAPPTAGAPTTHGPTAAPVPYPVLAIACPPPAVVPVGLPLTVPPQAPAQTNGTGCPPVALGYSDASFGGSETLTVVDYVNMDLSGLVMGGALDPVLDTSDAYIVASLVNGTTAGATVYIYNSTVLGLPLLASFSMASLAVGAGGPCAQSPGGAPQVQYDHVAQQWLLLQVTAPPYNSLCMYVSSTADPTNSAWRLYQFTAPEYPSQPKLAMFGDLYLVTTVEPVSGAVVYFIERQPVLNFELNTRFFRAVVPLASMAGPGPLVVAPVDNEAGPQPLYATAQGGAFVARAVDDELYVVNATAGVDYLDVFHYSSINFALGSYTLNYTRIAVPEFNSTTCDVGCVSQKYPGPALPSLRLPLSHRLVYRQRPATNTTAFTQSIVGSLYTAVVIGGNTSGHGVYWFELRAVNNGPTWALYQSSIKSAGGTAWTGAISMDGQGSIVLAFGESSKTLFLRTAATSRVATDPLNDTSSSPDVVIGVPNNGRLTDAASWGRYHAMSVTPGSNATVGGDFVTIGQYGTAGVRIGKLRIAPLHMARTWTADDACLSVQSCVQVFTS